MNDKKIVAAIRWLADYIERSRAGKLTNDETRAFAISTVIGVILVLAFGALCGTFSPLGALVLTIIMVTVIALPAIAVGFIGAYLYQNYEIIFSKEQIAIIRKEKADESESEERGKDPAFTS